MTTEEIARLIGGELEGAPHVEITGGAEIGRARPDQVAFLDDSRETSAVESSAAGCLVVGLDFPASPGRTLIRVKRPRNAFARALQKLHPPERPAAEIHATAVIDPSARLGEDVHVGPYSEIGPEAEIGDGCTIHGGSTIGAGVRLGPDSIVHSGVRIYPGVQIGARAILHAGCVLGADGFGLIFEGGRYEKFPQIGRVVIGDDVEIGANCCIDRAALGETVLGDGVKLDNMVHIGHNCRIGNHVVIAAQTGLAGAVVVEDYAVIGGQVGIGDKARIGSGAILGSGSGVLSKKTVTGGETYWGTPARQLREYLKNLARLDRLPKLLDEVAALKKRIAALEKK